MENRFVFRCASCGREREMLVCGGPGLGGEDPETGKNVWFFASPTELTKFQYTDTRCDLTEEEWQIAHEHAEGGCWSEPQCPDCGSDDIVEVHYRVYDSGLEWLANKLRLTAWMNGVDSALEEMKLFLASVDCIEDVISDYYNEELPISNRGFIEEEL